MGGSLAEGARDDKRRMPLASAPPCRVGAPPPP